MQDYLAEVWLILQLCSPRNTGTRDHRNTGSQFIDICDPRTTSSINGTNENEMPRTRLFGCPQVEFPIAIIDRNVDKQPPEARTAAEAFVRYCFTPEAQREFAVCGFR